MLTMDVTISELLEQFMSSPLVTWVKTFGPLGGTSEENGTMYMDLVDGVFLHKIMLQIDPRPTNQRVNKHVNSDINLRVQNLTILVRHIKNYYQECLQQLVVMTLPNVLMIAKDPLSGKSMDEMKKVLLLMLGCAVQCERKEEFIERIKQLDIATQTAIVAHIQEITHNQENVFDLQWMELTEVTAEDLENLSRSMVFHLKRLLDDRDEYSEMIVELTQDRDYLQSQQLLPSPVNTSISEHPSSPSETLDKGERQHLAVDLVDTKAKLRRIRQELEEKAEQLIDSRNEVERLDAELQRLRQENMQLTTDARSVRAYQDEVDSLREKANRVDRLENELTRCRERLHDVDFYKARMEELREDNMVLIETKTMLEEQLIVARARCDKLHDLEKENLQLKSKLQDLEMDREADRKRIEELVEENMVLEIEKKQSMNESAHLGWELEQMSKSTDLLDTGRKSFVLEMNESASSRILKLEKENQSLQNGVQELRQALLSAEESKARVAELEAENKLLSSKVGSLQTELEREKQSNQDMGTLSEELLQDKARLQESVDILQAERERQVKALEKENEHLNQAIASLRERSEISAEAKVKDIEKENKILHETISETTNQLTRLEFEKKQAHREILQYKEKEERAEALEKDVYRLEQDNEQLQKHVASLKITCESVGTLEQEVSNLELENSKLKKSLNSLQNSLIKLESVKKDNKQLDEENVVLRRMVETMKFARTKLIKEEMEKRELEKEKDELRKSVELLKSLNRKSERLEISYQGLESENQRLQKVLDNSESKVRQLEKELQDTETENHVLQRNLEELKVSSKRLEALEKDNKTLEHDAAQLEKEKATLDRENKRLWQQVELKDAILEENSQKLLSLEKERRALEKDVGRYKESTNKLKELEVDYKEVLKQSTINTRTLATLREELFHEKLRSQELSNELEKLNQELEKIGLTKERLLQEEHNSDDNKYRLLETRIESTLKKTLDIKEEKVQALESRLAESSNLNQQLRSELSAVKWNLEALLQRQEEEKLSLNSPVGTSPPSSAEKEKWEKESRETTLELLKVKDTVIEVERNNAALQAEKDLLKEQIKQLEAQNSAVNSQIVMLQRQAASMQEHSNALQIQNAKLQVENSTLNSQSASLMGQNAMLQNAQLAVENERDSLTRQKEELKLAHDSLLQDHERLMALNERQSTECEALIAQQASFKSSYRSLETQHKDLETRYLELLKKQAEVEQLDSELHAQRESLQRESRRNAAVTEENRQLKADVSRLHSVNGMLKEEYEQLQSLAKECRSSLNNTELELERWKAQYHELKERHQNLDISQTKIGNHCELLTQLKSNLEEENHFLLSQVQTLNQQNQNLLERSMESKELYHEEQKQYIDRLNSLRRQKEKLEEKIMDQYKFYEATPKRRNNWVTAKALVKLMKPRKESAKKQAVEGQARQTEPAEVATGPSASQGKRASLDESSQGSNSLEEPPQGTPSKVPTRKRFAFLRSKSKEKLQEKPLSPSDHRHSLSMGFRLWSSNDTSDSAINGSKKMNLKVVYDDIYIPSEGQRDSKSFLSSTPSPSANPSPESTVGMRHRRAELGSMAYSTSAIHLTPSHTTPKFNSWHRTRAKGFNSDDDLQTQSLELEFAKNGNASPGVAEVMDARVDSLSSEDLLPSRDVGAAPKVNALYRSSSTTLPSTKLDPAMSRRSPVSYSTLQRVKERPLECRTRASSPGSEMVTLEEFLQESGQSATSVSIRDDLLSDYFNKKREPSLMSEQLNRKEATRVPASLAAKTPFESPDGRLPKAGQCSRPSPRPAGHDATAPSSSTRQGAPPPLERAVQTQHPATAGPRGASLNRAVSLASADLRGQELATAGSWRSTGDCRSGGSQPERRPAPASTAPALDARCRTLDPRRLSLAPPKDDLFLSLPQSSGGLPSPRQRRSPGEPSPARAAPLRAEELTNETQSGPPNPARGAEDPRSTPVSPDPSSEQQTVWYEYGCV